MSVTDFAGWLCSHCGAKNETEIDLSAGHHQDLVEECGTCCQPNLLTIDVDQQTQEVALDAHAESE